MKPLFGHSAAFAAALRFERGNAKGILHEVISESVAQSLASGSQSAVAGNQGNYY